MRQLNPVSPKFIGVQLIGSAIVWAIFLIVLLAAAICGLIFDITWLMILGFALAAGCVILAIIEAIIVVRQVKALGYLEREHDLLVQRGIMFRSTTVVPYGRLQYVEVSAGPLLRMAGLATITLHTASAATDASLPGLPKPEAEALRDSIASRGGARLAGL